MTIFYPADFKSAPYVDDLVCRNCSRPVWEHDENLDSSELTCPPPKGENEMGVNKNSVLQTIVELAQQGIEAPDSEGGPGSVEISKLEAYLKELGVLIKKLHTNVFGIAEDNAATVRFAQVAQTNITNGNLDAAKAAAESATQSGERVGRVIEETSHTASELLAKIDKFQPSDITTGNIDVPVDMTD